MTLGTKGLATGRAQRMNLPSWSGRSKCPRLGLLLVRALVANANCGTADWVARSSFLAPTPWMPRPPLGVGMCWDGRLLLAARLGRQTSTTPQLGARSRGGAEMLHTVGEWAARAGKRGVIRHEPASFLGSSRLLASNWKRVCATESGPWSAPFCAGSLRRPYGWTLQAGVALKCLELRGVKATKRRPALHEIQPAADVGSEQEETALVIPTPK